MQSRYPENMSELLSLAEVASGLKIHPDTILQWSQKGFLRAHRIGHHGWWFNRAEVEEIKDWVLDRALDRGVPDTKRPGRDNRVTANP